MIIVDDHFDYQFREHIYKFITQSYFRIGWGDGYDLDNSRKYLYSGYSIDDMDDLGLLDHITDERILKELSGKKPYKIAVNMSKPIDVHIQHTHPGTTLLYYANLTWKPEWAGETLFYNETITDIERALMYTPGRLVVFDGLKPHTIRPQSIDGPSYRFTVTVFFNEDGIEK